ncbi:MAG: hypothetical protein H7A21_11755 [Spirochaetales bacterium]|nr:hypothetical protein [Leptospiraceae bacterium]MCP5482102.1 hypothetical protein [Spirochaetales bacterium]MCP5484942.1 hypothetical protein [Spirochaetales bacterium]
MKRILRRLRGRRGQLSHAGEEAPISRHLADIDDLTRFCVDIAAADGITQSNTYHLFRQDWAGVAVELDASLFKKLATTLRGFKHVRLARSRVTPKNVVPLLQAFDTPEKFGFLSLDIDSYDFFVLHCILSKFRPGLVCTEINEKIPPPIKFTVTYSDDHFWRGDHFYGQSISKLNELCDLYDYSIVELHYNNAFLKPKELSKGVSLTPEAAYEGGYRSRDDRLSLFPWNADMEDLYYMEPEEILRALSVRFSAYSNYTCTL